MLSALYPTLLNRMTNKCKHSHVARYKLSYLFDISMTFVMYPINKAIDCLYMPKKVNYILIYDDMNEL